MQEITFIDIDLQLPLANPPISSSKILHEITFSRIDEWPPPSLGRGVYEAEITPEPDESQSAESRYLNYISRLIKKWGKPHYPKPDESTNRQSESENGFLGLIGRFIENWRTSNYATQPSTDLATVSIDYWAIGEHGYYAGWITELGWNDLTMDADKTRIDICVNYT